MHASVRMLPKATGFRPLVNLSQRLPKADNKSINDVLQDTFRILQLEKERQPEKCGSSIRDMKDFKAKLIEFKRRRSLG